MVKASGWRRSSSEEAPREGFELTWLPRRVSDEEKLPLMREADFLVLHPAQISEDLLRAAKTLRLIQLLTAGYDKIDLGLTAELGIPVATNGGANAWSVAEHTVALLLALYKRLIQCDRAMREGRWREPISGFNTFEVTGKTLGLVGAGNIGRKVARRLAAFEARVIYYDVVSAPEIEERSRGPPSLSGGVTAGGRHHRPACPRHPGDRGDHRAGSTGHDEAHHRPTQHQPRARGGRGGPGRGLEGESHRWSGAGCLLHGTLPRRSSFRAAGQCRPFTPCRGHGYEGWFRRSRFAWENIRRVATGEPPLSVVLPK